MGAAAVAQGDEGVALPSSTTDLMSAIAYIDGL
jgi:hypothetical protein